jgi:hypothetical protein
MFPAERFIYINNEVGLGERLPKRYNGYNLKGGKLFI